MTSLNCRSTSTGPSPNIGFSLETIGVSPGSPTHKSTPFFTCQDKLFSHRHTHDSAWISLLCPQGETLHVCCYLGWYLSWKVSQAFIITKVEIFFAFRICFGLVAVVLYVCIGLCFLMTQFTCKEIILLRKRVSQLDPGPPAGHSYATIDSHGIVYRFDDFLQLLTGRL